jgi:hypothetical protein
MDSNLAYIGAVFPDEDDRDSVVQMDLDLGGVVLEKALVKEIKINPKRGGKVKSGKGKMWSNLKHRK